MSTPDKESKKPSNGRIMVWVAVGGIGLYLVVSGIIGIVAGG
ncbi:hypothetical protein ACWPKO_31370 (plasmid) [Coraliomargarita sp. W4R53]